MAEYNILNYLKTEDFLTISAALTSLTSIFYFTNSAFACGTITLFIAAAIDFLDGMLARRRGNTTEFGRNLDFLQDTITYCVAVAVLLQLTIDAWWMIYFIILLVSASLVRLARQQLVKSEEKQYVGLPVTFNLLLPLMYLFGVANPLAHAGLITILSILMLSHKKFRFI